MNAGECKEVAHQSFYVSGVSKHMAARKRGTVKWFNAEKGYGFITPESGEDVFVHYSEIQSTGYRSLNDGDKVEFDVAKSEKGFHASKVVVIRE
jgi:CspA family cold shock protein